MTSRKSNPTKLPAHYLAAIAQNATDAIISKDLEGIVTSWNPAAEHMFGFTAAEMVGQSIMRIIPAELAGEEAQFLEHIRNGRSIEHFETKRLRKDGRMIDVSL